MGHSIYKILTNIHYLVTMDDTFSEHENMAIVIHQNMIQWVGKSNEIPAEYLMNGEIIDLINHIVLPGLINTHHHMFQSLTRAVPKAQDAELFSWLKTLYPIWQLINPDMVRVSAMTTMAELILSGCTTTSDHLYLFPNGSTIEDEITAAQIMGIRFHAARGSMSVGVSLGGLPPDKLVEKEPQILRDSQELIEKWHDASKFSMLRIVLAPCSPFSVSENLMKQTALLARNYGVSLHTHLAENENDVNYTLEKFNQTPAQYAETLGWVGEDVWHAHCVKLDDHGIHLFAKSRTGVCHCPSSNMRLASGIAPIYKMMNSGVTVGLGVDGSASNDSSNLLQEVRQTMLLQRVAIGPSAMTARQALYLATRGGAKVLGREDIGSIEVGKSADVIGIKLDQLGLTGSFDKVAGIVFASTNQVDFNMINGQVLLQNGEFVNFDLSKHLNLHSNLTNQLRQ